MYFIYQYHMRNIYILINILGLHQKGKYEFHHTALQKFLITWKNKSANLMFFNFFFANNVVTFQPVAFFPFLPCFLIAAITRVRNNIIQRERTIPRAFWASILCLRGWDHSNKDQDDIRTFSSLSKQLFQLPHHSSIIIWSSISDAHSYLTGYNKHRKNLMGFHLRLNVSMRE